MGVYWKTCDECKETVSNCGGYFGCENCGKIFCLDCACDKDCFYCKEIDKNNNEIVRPWNYGDDEETPYCKYCINDKKIRVFTVEDKYTYLCEKYKIDEQKLENEMREKLSN